MSHDKHAVSAELLHKNVCIHLDHARGRCINNSAGGRPRLGRSYIGEDSRHCQSKMQMQDVEGVSCHYLDWVLKMPHVEVT